MVHPDYFELDKSEVAPADVAMASYSEYLVDLEKNCKLAWEVLSAMASA